MKLPNILITVALFTGCSSYHQPESFESKMSYFEATTSSKNIVPNFTAITPTGGRRPASVNTQVARETASLSNKRLYFSMLYEQYEQLGKMTQTNSPVINRCPNFHSGVVEGKSLVNFNNNDVVKNINWDQIELYYKNQNGQVAGLEFQLPLSTVDIQPNIADVYGKQKNEKTLSELMKEAIKVHLSKMHAELEELCEHGSSDNYYAFENLITSTSSKEIEYGQVGATTLLKTTVISNMALINSLSRWTNSKGRSPASIGQQELSSKHTELFRRLQTPWAFEYLVQYKQK